MSGRLNAVRWRDPAALAGLIGVLGFLIAGIVGAAVGVAAGAAGARRARAMLLAAALALLITVALTILEGPLSQSAIYGFPRDRPVGNVFGAIAGILLLAGLIEMLAQRGSVSGSPATAASRQPVVDPAPRSTIVALAAAILLGALILSLLADRSWDGPALALVFVILIIGYGFVLASAISRCKRSS